MRIEDSVSYLLAKVTLSHRNLIERSAVAIGLHSGQLFVLLELWKKDGQRQIDLAAKLGLAPPTVNKILGGLLDRDLVTRKRYEDDARSTRIFLTPEGHRIRDAVEAQWDAIEAATLEGLTETESLMLKQLLDKIHT